MSVKAASAASSEGGFAQVAALPLKLCDDGIVRVLLLTSRETKRWIIPKGWPMKGHKPCQAAAREAREEAGVVGRTRKKQIGSYSYFKRRQSRCDLCDVAVYVLMVEKQLETWQEKNQRLTRWFTLEEAARLVQEPGLAALLLNLAGALRGARGANG
jgi:8-oxo-dGTP pyrophosphatase MutT (NUDIX family)